MPVALVPVLALPLVAFLVALINAGGILLVYSYTDAFFDALERYVPVIGKRLAGAGRKVADSVANRIRRWNREYWASLPAWIKALREAQSSLDSVALSLATATRETFEHLLRPRRPGKEPGVIVRHGERLETGERRLNNLEATRPADIRADLNELIRRLYYPGTGDVLEHGRRLDTHLDRLERIQNVQLPGHTARLDNHHGRLTVIETVRLPDHTARLDNHHARIRGIEESEIPAGRARDAQQDARLSQLEPVASAITAAIPLAALAPTLGTLLRNEPKLRRFCSMDLDKFDDYFGFASPLPSLGLIRGTVRGAAGFAGELGQLLRVPLGR